VAWEEEVWLFFKVGRLRFFLFFKKHFFGGVGWGEDIFSRQYFKQINVIFLGMKKFQRKI
jgi:hypothetical protein